MSQIEVFAELGNGREDNHQFTINSGESVVCNFQASGINTATTKYYDLKSDAKRCAILVNKAATITHVNGHELSSPLPIGVASWNTWKKGIRWDKITVRADSDGTTFNVYAY